MRFLALACDYDGTLAQHGVVDAATIAALERLRASGRKLLLVTGRQLGDLERVFPQLHLFDRVVAENGALLVDCAAGEAEPLADAPPPAFMASLRERGVSPLSVGHVIVATWEPHHHAVLQLIRDLELELQVIFNKGAVMVLPTGVNKATGLHRALDALGLSAHNTVGVGDAENDHAFLAACACGVAVSNALESVKARADWVTPSDHGAGVVELIDRLIDSDLAELAPRLHRHDLVIGHDAFGADVRLSVYGGSLLVAGPSGAGKSTITTTLLERLCATTHQFALIDPEGDYDEFEGAIALRGSDARALADEALRVLVRPAENVVVNLLDLRLEDRPPFFQLLLPRLLHMRAATARPHWIVIDEAHHLLPSSWQPSEAVMPAQLANLVLVTVHPDHVSRSALALVDQLIAVGPNAQATVEAFARGRGHEPPTLPPHEDERGSSWLLQRDAAPVRFRSVAPAADRRRHQRKYAEGELGEDRSFYFRGPEGRLNLRAQNLDLFIQLADGVDDETWQFHVRQHDVSAWFRHVIKDTALADEAAEIESQLDLPARESRRQIRAAIARRYTAPA